MINCSGLELSLFAGSLEPVVDLRLCKEEGELRLLYAHMAFGTSLVRVRFLLYSPRPSCSLLSASLMSFLVSSFVSFEKTGQFFCLSLQGSPVTVNS